MLWNIAPAVARVMSERFGALSVSPPSAQFASNVVRLLGAGYGNLRGMLKQEIGGTLKVLRSLRLHLTDSVCDVIQNVGVAEKVGAGDLAYGAFTSGIEIEYDLSRIHGMSCKFGRQRESGDALCQRKGYPAVNALILEWTTRLALTDILGQDVHDEFRFR